MKKNKKIVVTIIIIILLIATGAVIYLTTFKNSKNATEIIKMVPLDKMLIETDSPYLSPEPLRGKRNDSRNVKYITFCTAFKQDRKSTRLNSSH